MTAAGRPGTRAAVRSPARSFVRSSVRAGSLVAALLTVHSAVNARLLRRPPEHPPAVQRRVSVLLPARDEAHQVGTCLTSLLGQTAVPDLEVLVLDDGSQDGTADVVRAVAGTDPRVRLLDGGTDRPPAGWLGKPWACHRLAAAATGSLLVLVDADVVLAPHAVAAGAALAARHGLDLVCPYPRQVATTPAERLVQPLLQWSWLTTLPLRVAERSARPSLTAANGQLLLVDADALARAGGYAAVRDQVLDDVALARAVKAAGGRATVVDGTDLASCRMYTGWASLRDGYGKSLWSAVGSPGGAAVAAVLAGTYVLPALAALAGSPAGALGYAAGVAGRVVTARRTGGRAWPDALAHPLSVALLLGLAARSRQLHARGALAWKGRPVTVRG